MHPQRPASRNQAIGLAAGLTALVVLMVLKVSGGLETSFEDLPLRLVSGFVLIIGLGVCGSLFASPPRHISENEGVGDSFIGCLQGSRMAPIALLWEL
jgi:hypothetical protein